VARTTIDELLAASRSGLRRLPPSHALAAMRSGAALIDIRGDSQIARDGTVPGALIIARNVLEWRLDPSSQHRHPQAPGLGDRVILLCDEGYQSSLAAATLQLLGFAGATDVDGGFQAWRQAGLPVIVPGRSARITPVPEAGILRLLPEGGTAVPRRASERYATAYVVNSGHGVPRGGVLGHDGGGLRRCAYADGIGNGGVADWWVPHAAGARGRRRGGHS
jgi:rhodanese-related sulfurtransferase